MEIIQTKNSKFWNLPWKGNFKNVLVLNNETVLEIGKDIQQWIIETMEFQWNIFIQSETSQQKHAIFTTS